MVKSCVAALTTEQAPAAMGDKVVVRKTGPVANEEVIVKIYNSESRFRHEMSNSQRLWTESSAALKPHLGVPYFGAKTSTDEVKKFFKIDKKGKITKNKAALNLHSGDTFAFKVSDCESTLSSAKNEVLYMTVNPKYETDLRTLLGKKGKEDKVEVLTKAFTALSRLNEKSVWSDAFVDNVMFHDGRAMIIDLDYLRDSERMFPEPQASDPHGPGGQSPQRRPPPVAAPPPPVAPEAPAPSPVQAPSVAPEPAVSPEPAVASEPAASPKPEATGGWGAPRAPRFGPAELVVPEALAFALAFERRNNTGAPNANEALPEDAIAPAYHPRRPGAKLSARVEGLPYVHPEGKTRVEWMRDAFIGEQSNLFPLAGAIAAVQPGGVVDRLASAFPTDVKTLAPLRLRYDPYRLAMSILLLTFDGGATWEPRDVPFVMQLLKGLVHADVTLRLSAADAVAWLEAFIKNRPAAIKKAASFSITEAAPMPRPPKTIKPTDLASVLGTGASTGAKPSKSVAASASASASASATPRSRPSSATKKSASDSKKQ